MIVVPAIPVFAAIAVFSPIMTLWAMWTRLSILTPLWISVSLMVPLSIVVLAPIETLFPIWTFPRCAIASQFLSFLRALPKPSEPIIEPGEIIQLLPIWQFSYMNSILNNTIRLNSCIFTNNNIFTYKTSMVDWNTLYWTDFINV